MLNTKGEVVAVAVASVVRGQNLNFAVPVNWTKSYLRGSPLRSLAEVSQENTVVDRILDGTVSVPAGQTHSWDIRVDRNLMSKPELQASFRSEGGATGNIRVLVLHGQKAIYDSGRVTGDDFRVDLTDEGTYQLVLDNRESMMFGRKVRGKIALRYVR